MTIELNRIVKGHRYDTSISLLLATNEKSSTQITTYLFRTKRGLFYFVRKFQTGSKKPQLVPIDKSKAIELYKELPQKFLEFEEAFTDQEDQVGRPPLYEKPLIKTSFWLREEMIEWMKKQPGNMSEVLRNLIQEAMKKQP